MRCFSRSCGVLLLLLVTVSGSSTAAVRRASVRELGMLPGHMGSTAIDVNESGRAAVASQAPDQTNHACYWNGRRLVGLPELPGHGIAIPAEMNAKGEMVGSCQVDFSDYGRAVLWRGGRAIDLGTLPGDEASGATGINDRGQVVGWSWSSSSGTRGFIWKQGRMSELTNAEGSIRFIPNCIDNRGQVGGVVGDHVVRLLRGTMTNLGTLPNTMFAGIEGNSNRGVIVGLTYGTDSLFHPALWDQSAVQLPTLADDAEGIAYDVNSRGVAIGRSFDNGGESHAVIWEGSQVTELRTLLPAGNRLSVHNLQAINDGGHIAGGAYNEDTQRNVAVIVTLNGR